MLMLGVGYLFLILVMANKKINVLGWGELQPIY